MKNTKEAIIIWDANKTQREELWDKAFTNKEIYAAIKFEKMEVNKVRGAFYEDTKEFNNRSHANLIHPDDSWLRILLTR